MNRWQIAPLFSAVIISSQISGRCTFLPISRSSGFSARTSDEVLHAQQAQQRGRGGVTLHMLMAEGIVTPADRSLTVEDAGSVFYADVLSSGEVR